MIIYRRENNTEKSCLSVNHVWQKNVGQNFSRICSLKITWLKERKNTVQVHAIIK